MPKIVTLNSALYHLASAREQNWAPGLFLVMINDLDTPADMWKYVDDTSCSEIVTKGGVSKLQEAVDDLSRQASIDGFQLNEAKCKELRIGFSNNNHDFEPPVLNGKPLELVASAKLLDMIISHDLRASLCKILISTFAHKMDFANNFSVDFF